MNDLLRVVGVSHRTAPVEVRERYAIADLDLPAALARVRDACEGGEAAVVSTCNRVEVYACGGPPTADLLAAAAGVRIGGSPGVFAHAGRDAAAHLFRVTSSLDSMVVGETQILGQVRRAYEVARGHGTAGPVLHRLFQRALRVGREVLADPDLSAGRLSVAGVAAACAGDIFETLADKTVVCLGAGKMARLVLERLARPGVGRLVVANRNVARARDLAARFGGTGRGLDDVGALLADADVVVCNTGSRVPVVTRDLVEAALRRRRYRPLFLLDIAVPRDVEASVAGLTNVYLYNVDDLAAVVDQTRTGRAAAVGLAEARVAAAVADFFSHRPDAGRAIRTLYDRAGTLADAELQRTLRGLRGLPGLPPEVRTHVEAAVTELSRRTVNKILHGPATVLRAAGTAGEAGGVVGRHGGGPYVHAVEHLFGLSDGPGPRPAREDDAPAG